MAKQTFTTGQVLTAAQMTSLQQTAMLGGAASAKTASYTLVAADAGTAISMSSASATTITVNTALFAAGDTVQITNLGAGVCTITAGTATVNSSASLALAQYESGTLDFTSTSAAIFIKGAGAAAASGGMTLLSTTTLSGSSVTISSISGSYKNLYIVGNRIDGSTGDQVLLRLNADTGSNYLWQCIKGSGSTAGAEQGTSQTSIRFASIGDTNNYAVAGYFVLEIPRYSETEIHSIYAQNRCQVGGDHLYRVSTGVYSSTTAITSITIFTEGGATFDAGTVYVYGVN